MKQIMNATLPQVLRGCGRTTRMTEDIQERLQSGQKILLITASHRTFLPKHMETKNENFRQFTVEEAEEAGWSLSRPYLTPCGYGDKWFVVIDPCVFTYIESLLHRYDPPLTEIAMACQQYEVDRVVNWGAIREQAKGKETT